MPLCVYGALPAPFPPPSQPTLFPTFTSCPCQGMHAVIPKMFFPVADLPEGPPDLTGYPAMKPGMTQLVSVKGINGSGMSTAEMDGG